MWDHSTRLVMPVGVGAAYETDTAEVMRSAPYLQAQNHPTPWTRPSVGHFRYVIRTIYTLVASAGQRPRLAAPYVFVERSNPPAGPGGETGAVLVRFRLMGARQLRRCYACGGDVELFTPRGGGMRGRSCHAGGSACTLLKATCPASAAADIRRPPSYMCRVTARVAVTRRWPCDR